MSVQTTYIYSVDTSIHDIDTLDHVERREGKSNLNNLLAFVNHPKNRLLNDPAIDDEFIVMIIHQYFVHNGYTRSINVLEKEAIINKKCNYKSCLLPIIVNRAQSYTDQLYDKISKNRVLDEYFDVLGAMWDEYLNLNIKKEEYVTYDHKGELEYVSLYSLIKLLLKDENKTLRKVFYLTYKSFATNKQIFEILKSMRNDEEINEFVLEFLSECRNDFDISLFDYWRDIHNNPSLRQKFIEIMKRKDQIPVTDQLYESLCNEDSVENLWNTSSEEIARQMCLLDYERLYKLDLSELLNQNWNKPHLKHRAYTIHKFVKSFNEISVWISSLIVTPKDIKERVRRIQKWVEILMYLNQFGNFNAVNAIIGAFKNVNKLKKTWESLSIEYHERIKDAKEVISRKHNKKQYRQTVSLRLSNKEPCIPFLGIYLTDLIFIDEGNPTFINNHINWYKQKALYETLNIIEQCRNIPYPFKPNKKIQLLLTKLDGLQSLKKIQRLCLQREK